MAERVEDIPAIVERILSDPKDLLARQERARASAREDSRWDRYVERVGTAIAAIEAESDAGDAPWRQVAAELVRREFELGLRRMAIPDV